MTADDCWMLPDGIDELLPPQASVLEKLRRGSLDLLAAWGYELVEPPIIENLDALLSGMGQDLDLQTFKLIDQLSGRMMGLRADMTPQIARIDAHRLRREEPTRLCYVGSILHTLPESFAGSRNPLQLGAELYGHAGIEADAEILSVMLGVLRVAGIDNPCIDLGHVGVFRGLVEAAGVEGAGAARLLAALQRKDRAELNDLIKDLAIAAPLHVMFTALLELSGEPGVLDEAAELMARGPARVKRVIDDLCAFTRLIQMRDPSCRLHVDLAEQSSYQYHTGFIFAAYVAGQGNAIAAGGRYDEVGSLFGRPRSATGFSTDLKHLVKLDANETPQSRPIIAPAVEDRMLETAIARLRAQGEIVVRALPGAATTAPRGPTRNLVNRDGHWQITEAKE